MRIFFFLNSLTHRQSYFQSGLGEKGLDINKLEHLFFPTIFLIIFLVFFMSHYFHTENTLHLEQENTFTYLFIYAVFLRNRSMLVGKGGFFSESEIRFSNLPTSQKNYSKKLSWAWNLKFSPISVNNLFKFQAQDSFLE